jgi:hypothetical protein
MTANYVVISILLTQSLSSAQRFYMFRLCSVCSDDTMRGADVNKPIQKLLIIRYTCLLPVRQYNGKRLMERTQGSELSVT